MTGVMLGLDPSISCRRRLRRVFLLEILGPSPRMTAVEAT